MSLSKFYILAMFLFLSNIASAYIDIKAPPHFVVSIKTRAVLSAYSGTGVSFGTGFFIDTNRGIIVTNKHVARPTDVVTDWVITLFDGQEVHADLIYSDPWHDFSLLKVKDQSLIKNISSPKLSVRAKARDEVVIVGKNENKHFSRQTGTIASLYESEGHLQQQSIRINLNAQGGASGSPVMNEKGEVIALLFASNGFTSAFSLPIQYIKNAYDVIVKGEGKPSRFGTGAVVDYQSLDEFVRFNNFPKKITTKYRKYYPDARNRALSVKTILVNTPAEGRLEVGDVIIKINDTNVGASLYDYERIMNEAGKKGDTVKLKIIRFGETLKVEVGTYDLHKPMIKRIVFFGGATFFEMNDFIKSKTGCRTEKVFICQARPSSSFTEKLPTYPGTNSMLVAIKSVDGVVVSNLDDLVEAAKKAMKKEYFPIVFKNYGIDFGYDRDPSFNHADQLTEITYSRYDGPMQIFNFNDKKGRWELAHR